MPKLTGASVPKYREHKASGQAVVTLNGRESTWGRGVLKSAYANTIVESLSGCAVARYCRCTTSIG
jgi:hypothetical protein